MNVDEMVAAATARAERDTAAAIVELERAVENLPEWELSERFNGTRYIIPKRAIAAGMLAHIKGASR